MTYKEAEYAIQYSYASHRKQEMFHGGKFSRMATIAKLYFAKRRYANTSNV